MNGKIIGLYLLNGIKDTNKIRIKHIRNVKLEKNTIIRDKEIDF